MENRPKNIPLKIVRTNPNHLDYVFANDVIVNHDENHFYIQFGQISPPQIIDQNDLENFDILRQIEVPTVSRIVITKDFMRALVRVLNENIQKGQSAPDNRPPAPL
ncbi:MAG: DUF3467 domain-containing protein [Anaerolineaceae bacterium]|nr:DUF3467 domain-containing protein [Anaerolineaceae bacterium]